jgi:hypothetical protein
MSGWRLTASYTQAKQRHLPILDYSRKIIVAKQPKGLSTEKNSYLHSVYEGLHKMRRKMKILA